MNDTQVKKPADEPLSPAGLAAFKVWTDAQIEDHLQAVEILKKNFVAESNLLST